MSPRVAELSSRAVIAIGGEDAAAFLDRLVTCDMERVAARGAAAGALLTAQGKILSDFILLKAGDGYLLDAPRQTAADLLKRLTMFRLRAAVTLADASGDLAVLAVWNAPAPPAMPGRLIADPRHPGLGHRAYVPRAALGPAEAFAGATIVGEADYDAHRIALGVPEGGADFAFGDAFPHDAGLDALGGVAFDKGCYVGQEVVSRMQHRGTARRRPVQVTADATLPPPGTPVEADGKAAGALGSIDGHHGIAILRLDRVKAARDAGRPVTAGGIALAVTLPDWATWDWPATADPAGD